MKEEVVSSLLSYLDSTHDFVLTQAPEVFSELIMYNLIKSIIVALFVGSLALGSLLIVRAIVQGGYTDIHGHYSKHNGYDEEAVMPALVVGLISLTLFAWTLSELCTVIKCLVAPRIYLLEWVLNR